MTLYSIHPTTATQFADVKLRCCCGILIEYTSFDSMERRKGNISYRYNNELISNKLLCGRKNRIC